MKAKAILGLAAVVIAAAVAAAAAQAYTLFDFQGAVSALSAVDPTISAPANDPSKDMIVGGFRSTDGYNNGVSAQSDPANLRPKGQLSATHPTDPDDVESGFRIRGKIVCMAVQGNLAATGIEGTLTSQGTTIPYTEIEVYRDGGPGGTLDGFRAFSSSQEENCADFLVLAAGADPLINGNVLINDAP
jgi:hypothetical protein